MLSVNRKKNESSLCFKVMLSEDLQIDLMVYAALLNIFCYACLFYFGAPNATGICLNWIVDSQILAKRFWYFTAELESIMDHVQEDFWVIISYLLIDLKLTKLFGSIFHVFAGPPPNIKIRTLSLHASFKRDSQPQSSTESGFMNQ